MSNYHVPRRPTLLIILDGVGVSPRKENNGVYLANTPNLDSYLREYVPYTHLQASGESVGLPDGQMGNSEVGHLTLGTGQILKHDLLRINEAIHQDTFKTNPRLLAAMNRAKAATGRLHLLGLVSDGGVHSHVSHLIELIHLCAESGVAPVLHMITDGRDTPPRSALMYLAEIELELHKAGGQIGSVMGRFYAMDRDRRWDRTERAWRALVYGEGLSTKTAGEAIRNSYENDTADEFIDPTLCEGIGPIKENEPIICFNFRSDRVRQIVASLTDKEFRPFDRGAYLPRDVVCMTEYASHFNLPVAFQPEHPPITLAEVISDAGIKQFHCAETEKYAHITYFFNGGREQPYPGEERIMIPSPKVKTYDQAPEMSARKVASTVVDAIEKEEYGFIAVNFANGDMVGHTAKRDAVIRAVETLDCEVDKVIQAAIRHNYSIVVTADHGNCEEMVHTRTGQPHTQHTTNPVPCFVIDQQAWALHHGAGISAIAPTVLELMGLPIPTQMQTGSLLHHEDNRVGELKKRA